MTCIEMLLIQYRKCDLQGMSKNVKPYFIGILDVISEVSGWRDRQQKRAGIIFFLKNISNALDT